jgi:DNA-binding NarL/FixJ family response regulator
VADPAEALELGRFAYADDRLDDARQHFEAAFNGFKQDGNGCAAARVATVLSQLHGDMLGNPAAARGWSERAKRLLDEVGPCVEWGYYELARMACDRPDIDDLVESAERARQIAVEYGDPGLEVRALADGGLALISQGRVKEGFDRLDEALAALSTGEIQDPYVIGTSLCALLSSCDRAGDVERAQEWIRLCHAMMLDPFEGRPRVLGTHCKVAFGGVLCTAGRWTEAEQALLDALGPGESQSYGHRLEATARLAEVRVHQGRVDEAADLLAGYEDAVQAAGPLALVHLHRDQPDLAAGVLRQAVKRMVGDVLRSGPLVATLVEVELRRGNTTQAQQAAELLRSMATAVDADDVHAIADLAHARVTGDPAAFERAIERSDRPLLVATARLELADALAATDTDAAIAEARAAHAAAQRLGATALTDRAAATLRRLGAAAPRKDQSQAFADLTARETDVLDGITRGDTNAEIAARLYLSPKTVEHHVSRVLAKLGVRTRAEAAALAAGSNKGR